MGPEEESGLYRCPGERCLFIFSHYIYKYCIYDIGKISIVWSVKGTVSQDIDIGHEGGWPLDALGNDRKGK
jgi:hypothetical protein